MATHRTHNRSTRLWRWGLALAVVAALLGGWWLALEQFATRVGLDAESTMRELPRSGDASRRSD